jgi:hypothetical protein
MERLAEPMKVALRVLAALSDRQAPSIADIAQLKAYVPDCAATPLDELACEVIQQALKSRAAARARSAPPWR